MGSENKANRGRMPGQPSALPPEVEAELAKLDMTGRNVPNPRSGGEMGPDIHFDPHRIPLHMHPTEELYLYLNITKEFGMDEEYDLVRDILKERVQNSFKLMTENKQANK